MREQEVACFARALHCARERIEVADMIAGRLERRAFDRADMILIGGSGAYSAAGEGAWLERALEALREIHALARPAFASCWGFQAMARALGGQVVKDLPRAELGTIELELTDAGREDPVFGPLGATFSAQAGHEDHVVALPPGATLLASSSRVAHQAYRFDGKPIYCTQFHPELSRDDLAGRLQAYPHYVAQIAQMPLETFLARCTPTPEAEALLQRFVQHVFGE